jgi:hypothetical protein
LILRCVKCHTVFIHSACSSNFYTKQVTLTLPSYGDSVFRNTRLHRADNIGLRNFFIIFLSCKCNNLVQFLYYFSFMELWRQLLLCWWCPLLMHVSQFVLWVMSARNPNETSTKNLTQLLYESEAWSLTKTVHNKIYLLLLNTDEEWDFRSTHWQFWKVLSSVIWWQPHSFIYSCIYHRSI